MPSTSAITPVTMPLPGLQCAVAFGEFVEFVEHGFPPLAAAGRRFVELARSVAGGLRPLNAGGSGRVARAPGWLIAAMPRTTSPITITAGLPSCSRARVSVSAPSVLTAWRCWGRVACWMMASGVLAGRPVSRSCWIWAAPETPM